MKHKVFAKRVIAFLLAALFVFATPGGGVTAYAASYDAGISKLKDYLSSNQTIDDWNDFYDGLLSEADGGGDLDEIITALRGSAASFPIVWSSLAASKLKSFDQDSVPDGFHKVLGILIETLTPDFDTSGYTHTGTMLNAWLESGDGTLLNNVKLKLDLIDFLLIDSYYQSISDEATGNDWHLITLGENGDVDLNKIFGLASSLSGTTDLEDMDLEALSPALEEIGKLIAKLEDRASNLADTGTSTTSDRLATALGTLDATSDDGSLDLDPFFLTFGAKALDEALNTDTFSTLAENMIDSGMGVEDISAVVSDLADSGLTAQDISELSAILPALSTAGIELGSVTRLISGEASWEDITSILVPLGFDKEILATLPQELKNYFNDTLAKLQEYANKLNGTEIVPMRAARATNTPIDIAYILQESQAIINDIQDFTLMVFYLLPDELMAADNVDDTQINTFFENLMPEIKKEIKEQLAPWEASSAVGTSSYLYYNSTSPAAGNDGNVDAIDIEAVWGKLGGTLGDTVNDKLDKYFGGTHGTIKATLKHIFGQTIKFIFDLHAENIDDFKIEDLKNLTEDQVVNFPVDTFINQIWGVVKNGNLNKAFVKNQLSTFIAGIDALGSNSTWLASLIANSVIDLNADENDLLTNAADQIVTSVYQYLVGQIADEISTNPQTQQAITDIINGAATLQGHLYTIANYTEKTGNVEIEISSGEESLYILDADTLSNNYDTFVYGDSDNTDPNLQKGYLSALEKLGFELSYELLKFGDLPNEDTNFHIVGNAIEVDPSYTDKHYVGGDAGSTEPYKAVVAAYATLQYSNVNSYEWKFLFATKYTEIVNAVAVTYNSNYTAGPAAVKDIGDIGSYVILSNSFTRAGYTFQGWSTTLGATVADSTYAVGATYSGTDPLTLYAVWRAIGSSINLPSSNQHPTTTIVNPTVTATPTPSPVHIYDFTTDSEISDAATRLADQLYDLKLFYGVGTDSNGKPIYALDTALNRLEALTLVIRLLGLEQSALAYTGANPFGDVPQWGDRIVAYAYAQGITVGVSSTKFDPASLVTQQQFSAFLLRVLGYYEKYGDFEYRDAVSKAVAVDLFTQSEANLFASKEYYLRAYAVINMCDELQTALKGSRTLLIDNLVAQGVLTRANANDFLSAIAKIYYR
ncbi:MAG: InlB B-repeat-containing protein [Clostridiales bacterium]|jgi:uncharacterized repeat protein (TIGR02543 family)|nr:InlB B-repeat-containing protein [Clostridiales bacterium]